MSLAKKCLEMSEVKFKDILADGDRRAIAYIVKETKKLRKAGKSDKEILKHKLVKDAAPASLIQDVLDGKSEKEIFIALQKTHPEHLKEEMEEASNFAPTDRNFDDLKGYINDLSKEVSDALNPQKDRTFEDAAKSASTISDLLSSMANNLRKMSKKSKK